MRPRGNDSTVRRGRNLVGTLTAFLRIRLLPTAAADVLAGAFLAGSPAYPALGAVLIVSGALYLFGMASNAILDRAVDARLYPDRPLPSGRLSTAAARTSAGILLATAALASYWCTANGRVLAGVLLALIIAYNTAAKRIPVAGPVVMGSCRAINLLLGAVGAGAAEAELCMFPPVTAACLLGAYVAGVTYLSSREGRGDSPLRRRVTVSALLPVPIALAGLFSQSAWTLLPAALLVVTIARSLARAAPPNGHPIDEGLVHGLLPGIYLIDATFLAYAGMTVLAAVCTLAGAAPLGSMLWRRT